MSILSRLFSPGLSATYHSPVDDFWYSSIGQLSHSGIRVTEASAFNVSAVYAAVRIVSETVAQIPLIIYRRMPNGGKQRAENHPLFDLLKDQPNAWQTSFEWREMMTGHLALRGNAYNEIISGPRGAVDQLIPLHPDRVVVKQLDSHRLIYQFRPTEGDERILNQDNIFHIRGLSSDGFTGISPIALMRESIGLALATEKYGAGLFTSDGAIRGVLKHPGILTPDGRTNLKASFSKGSASGTALLEEGLSWEKIGMTAEDAQFLMTRKFQINEFARWFNIPPHLLRDLDKATFSNIEQQAIDFVLYSMMPWFRRWEQAITRDLIIVPQTFFAEFLIEGLLRGDTKSRYEAYASAITNGWLTRNEARIKENLNPLPGLDIPLAQANMNPAVAKYSSLIKSVSARMVKKEVGALRLKYCRMAKNDYDAFIEWLNKFYVDFTSWGASVLEISLAKLSTYTEGHRSQLVIALRKQERKEIVSVENIFKQWETNAIQELTDLAMEEIENVRDNGEKISSPNDGNNVDTLGDFRREAQRNSSSLS